MAYKKWILRILRVTALSVLAVVLLLFAAVQFQQHLLRWRAERLMADMHQIRLYQSTWADAQKLMDRWGKWGHYDGSCTAAECRYFIDLSNAGWRSWDREPRGVGGWLMRHHSAHILYRWIGGRFTIVQVGFIVQDGTIWRTISWTNIEVPPKLLDCEDCGYTLMTGAKSQQALHRSEGEGSVFGGDDVPSEHPYYKMGRPGGCENCLMAGITYSTHTPQAEIERLTSFDFSCLTRLVSCRMPEDLMPATREGHLYDYLDPNSHEPSIAPRSYEYCKTFLWAVARDAGTILIVDVLSIKQEKEYSGSYQLASVKIDGYLKGDAYGPLGSVRTVEAKEMVPGKHYIVFPEEDIYGKRNRYGDDSLIAPGTCGVQEDTPENRRELEKGFAQNDHLRGPELR
ncbi:MAG: hypothetical protein WAN35_15350 [Terracidiphilus sp.]